MKAVDVSRLDGDLGSERILGVSSIAVTVSDVEKETKGVLFIFGKASNLEAVLVVGRSLFSCVIILCESIWLGH